RRHEGHQVGRRGARGQRAGRAIGAGQVEHGADFSEAALSRLAPWATERDLFATTPRPLSKFGFPDLAAAAAPRRRSQPFGLDETLCLISRPFSRSQSRSLMVLRLSCSALPL